VSTRRPPSRPPDRPARRPSWLAAAVALLLPVVASAAGTPVSLYLPSAEMLSKDEAADVEAVLISGLHQAARGGTITVRDPPLLRPSCGRNPTDACLAGLAGNGAVLVARARRDGIHVVVAMALVNGQGRRTRWTSFLTTLSVQDARPCAQALFLLEDEFSRLGSGPPVAAAPKAAPKSAPRPEPVERPAAAPAAAAAAAAVVVPPPPAPVPPPAPPPSLAVEQRYPPPPPAPSRPPPRVEAAGGWSTGRAVGAWTAAGGLLVLAAGAYAGLQARSLDADLTDKFDAGTLTPADQPSYAEVRRWNGAANGLFIAGGVLTAGGATLFFLSPKLEPIAGGGLSVGLAGRF
jgi:hypothetical protein